MTWITKMLNTGLGTEQTIGDDIYDYWLEGRNISHGIVDIKTLKNFEKKKFSMFDELVKAADKPFRMLI